jgi:hypothetical protein
MKKIILFLVMAVALTTQTLVSQVPSYVPTSGLLAYYPFNGNANDESGNGHNGTVNEAILSADRNGNANSSYSFDGDNDYITTNFVPHTTNQSRTISLWFNANDATMPADGYSLVSYGATTSDCSQAGGRFELGMYFNPAISAKSIKIDGVCTAISASTTYSNGWHNFVATYDNSLGNLFSYSKIYIDGVFVTGLNYIPNTIMNTLNLTNFTVGKSPSSPTQRFYNGLIDEIGIWNRALTQQEITNLYNSSLPQTACLPANVPTTGLVGYWPFCGNSNDESGNANNGTVNGATLTTDRFGNSNSAYSFDGNSSIVVNDADMLDLTNDFTISSWLNSSSYPTNPFGGPINMILCKRPNVVSNITGTYSFGIWESNGSHLVSCQAPPNASALTYPGSNGTIQTNQWYNFTATYDNTNKILKYYLNGTEIFNSNLEFIIANTPYNLTIGALTSAATYYWNGKLDDIGIWNRVLTQEEITNLYNANQCITNITVTDTLIINVGQLSFNDPVTWANNITIAPNPASSQININFNNITNLNGGTLKIINSLGQEVATTPITTSGTNSTMQLATWGGTGMYFVQIINPQGQIVDIKKIILQ